MKNIELIKNTDKEFPQNLLNIEKSPKELYIMGNKKLLNKKSLAIVGTRNCTPYGAECAEKFATDISKKNICIISGMALGIDTFAHNGALKEKGNTIAVLGCGFDYIYPEENIDLFNKIVENGGLVVSEYPPKTKAVLSKFPYRNRIISGLSMGTLVVEATRNRSGSLVTARYAKEQNKKIFSIPGNINLKTSGGTNELIKGGAKLVTCANDILTEFKIIVENTPEKNEKSVEPEFLEIYNQITYMPININVIAKKCKLDIANVSQKLLLMELRGYVKSMPGNEYVRV